MTDVATPSPEVLANAASAAAAATYAPSRVPQIGDRPARRARRYTIISVDDHLVEPPDMFEGRMPAKFADRSPRVVETADGNHAWVLDGTVLSQIAINAVAGQQKDSVFVEPTRFEMIRAGAYDVHERIADMDVDGVYASLNFPSLVGFAGVRLQGLPDQEFALATVKAWNDWNVEVWAGSYPDRLIACQIPWLNNAEVAAAEIRRNAARGCKAVTFPELPGKLGFEPLSSPFWDPFWEACEETETIICVHTGSSGLPALTEKTGSVGAIFGAGYAMLTAMDWLFARYGVALPRPEDLSQRRRYRLGGWRVRPPRPRRGLPRLPHQLARPHAARRRLPAQLLVLHAERPLRHVAAASDRSRQDHLRGRLPARRHRMARQPATPPSPHRRTPEGGGRHDRLAQRV